MRFGSVRVLELFRVLETACHFPCSGVSGAALVF